MSAGCLGAAGIWGPAMSAPACLMWTASVPALACAAGADDFTVKPFDPAVLLDKVRVLLARRD
jgi:CheY-like chemotaxis protein